MSGLIEALTGLIRAELRDRTRQAAGSAALGAALLILVLIAAGLALALLTLALSLWLGPLWALTLELGVTLVGCLALWLALRVQARRAAERRKLERDRRTREALVALLPLMRHGPALVLGVVALAAALFAGAAGTGGGDDDKDGGDKA